MPKEKLIILSYVFFFFLVLCGMNTCNYYSITFNLFRNKKCKINMLILFLKNIIYFGALMYEKKKNELKDLI